MVGAKRITLFQLVSVLHVKKYIPYDLDLAPQIYILIERGGECACYPEIEGVLVNKTLSLVHNKSEQVRSSK